MAMETQSKDLFIERILIWACQENAGLGLSGSGCTFMVETWNRFCS